MPPCNGHGQGYGRATRLVIGGQGQDRYNESPGRNRPGVRSRRSTRQMRLAVIGVPYNSSGASGGEALGPAVLREHGLIEALARSNDVVDLGDVSFESSDGPRRDRKTGLIGPRTMLSMITAVRGAVARAYEDRRMPMVVGGDCPLLLGCLLAARDRLGFPVGLIFVDGHEDAWDPHGSVTGESADMELGLALGVTSVNGLPELMAELPLLDPHEVVLLGARDRAEIMAEGQQSVGGRVIVLDDAQLRSAGIENTIGRWLDHLGQNPGRFWLHLDWDVLSSEDMPAVSYPQPGGLHWDEARQIATAAINADHLIGIDLTIYNPDLDPDRSAARRIVDFVADATGPAERERPRARTSLSPCVHVYRKDRTHDQTHQPAHPALGRSPLPCRTCGSWRARSGPGRRSASAARTAATRMASLNSFHFEIETIEGRSTVLDNLEVTEVVGDVLRPDSFQATITAAIAVIDVDVEVVSVGGSVWVTNPIEGGWQQIADGSAATGRGRCLHRPDQSRIGSSCRRSALIEEPTIDGNRAAWRCRHDSRHRNVRPDPPLASWPLPEAGTRRSGT